MKPSGSGFEFCLCHRLVVKYQASCFNSLSLNVIASEMGMILSFLESFIEKKWYVRMTVVYEKEKTCKIIWFLKYRDLFSVM